MTKTLKELYGIREMSVEIPDKDVPSLDSVVKDAILAGKLPAEALYWLYGGKGKGGRGSAQQQAQAGQPVAKGKKGKAEPKTQKAEPAQVATQQPPAAPAPKPVPPPTPPAPAQAAPPVAQKPVPKRPSPEDVAQGAWSRMGGTGRVPTPPAGQELDTDLGAPQSANVKLNKFGQPIAGPSDFSDTGKKKKGALSRIFKGKDKEPEPAAIQPKRGALSRIFGVGKGKGGPQVQANPAHDDPSVAAPLEIPGPEDQPQPKKRGGSWPLHTMPEVPPDEVEPTSGGQQSMNDLGTFLGKSSHQPKSKSDRSAGNDVMSDLDWDVKRAPKGGSK